MHATHIGVLSIYIYSLKTNYGVQAYIKCSVYYTDYAQRGERNEDDAVT